MRLRIEHHYSNATLTIKEIEMAVSAAFQAQLDRLTQLVGADRSSQAVTLADAVKAQAEADQAAIKAAHDDLATAEATATQEKQDLQDQVDALTAKLDALSNPAPAPAAVSETPAAPASTASSGPSTGEATVA